jgi:hypothetical protein
MCKFGKGLTPPVLIHVANDTIDDQFTLAEFWEQLIGLVLCLTSRKALSMALVVRTFFQ